MKGCKKGVPHKTYGKMFIGNWSNVIVYVKERLHLSNKQLAFLLNCHTTSVSKWYTEKWCPSEEFGAKLLLLANRIYIREE